MMRGRQYATGGALPQRDLQELTDLLAIRLYQKLGQRAYRLTRQDVADLVDSYVSDLVREDREMIPWLVWDLLQEGMEIEYAMH